MRQLSDLPRGIVLGGEGKPACASGHGGWPSAQVYSVPNEGPALCSAACQSDAPWLGLERAVAYWNVKIAWPEGLGGEEDVVALIGEDGFLVENSTGVYFKSWESVWSGRRKLVWKSDAKPVTLIHS